jgi:hypothetical protein
MKMKSFGLAVGVWAAAMSAAAFEISEEVRLAIQQDVEAVEQEGPRMGDVMAALRESGASYLPELVAPRDRDQYQSTYRRRLMTGVYLMDLTYAATFDQREPAARFGQALHRLLDDLGFPRPDMERRYRETLDQIDLPGGDERLRQLVKEQETNSLWQEQLQSGEGVELVVDGLYGFLIEGLYLTVELCVLSDYTPSSMMYVSYMRDSFQAYKRLLYRVGDIPELAQNIERDQRLSFLTSMLLIMGDLPHLGPDQIDSLRPSILKARRDIVQ